MEVNIGKKYLVLLQYHLGFSNTKRENDLVAASFEGILFLDDYSALRNGKKGIFK